MTTAQKIALVTGASRGIGQAIAKQLGQTLGYRVMGTATTEAGALRITEAFTQQSIAGEGLCLDVTDVQQVEQVIADIKARYGAVAVLVNNAGITKDDLVLRMKQDAWQSVIDTNLTAVYRLSACCLKDMLKARWGRIITISSVIGRMGNAGQANYAAAKAGVEGFTRALAREVGSRHITVNAVAPGFIQTDMTAALTDEYQQEMIRSIALGRQGTVDEVAAVVSFLAGDGAGYITGETIQVNGGLYMG